MDRQSVVIIGAGPAGIAAAVQCRRLGMNPLVLDREGLAGGLLINGFMVENYPGLPSPIDGQTLAEQFAAHLARFQLDVTRASVTGITAMEGGFRLDSNIGVLSCDNVIFAGGTRPIPLSFQGSEPLRERDLLLDDLSPFLRNYLPWPARAVVVGGGEAAMDYSLSLAAHGCRVQLLVRANHLKGNERLHSLIVANPEISVSYGVQVHSADDKNGLLSLCLRKTGAQDGALFEIFDVERVLGAIGRRSRLDEVLPAIATAVGEISLTPFPGLFICGDARLGGLGQVGIAVGDGLLAAMRVYERRSGGGFR